MNDGKLVQDLSCVDDERRSPSDHGCCSKSIFLTLHDEMESMHVLNREHPCLGIQNSHDVKLTRCHPSGNNTCWRWR